MFALLTKGQYVASLPPKWEGQSMPVTIQDLQASIRRHSPRANIAGGKDTAYIAVPYAVLTQAVQWTLNDLRKKGVVYTKNAFDCEDFVNKLHVTLREMAALANIQLSPLDCCIAVDCKHDWATVPAGTMHALAAVYTDRGVVITESQNGQCVAIEEYPNRSTIVQADNF
jgi:hypothetical protein